MPAIKSSQEIAAKWSRVTQGRSQDFQNGVKSPRRSWVQSTVAAEDSYKAGVTAAANEGRFGKGATAAGDKKWQDKSVNIGVARWAPGVTAATKDFESGFAPFADVISKTTLNPRYPKGDPRNYQRVQQIGDALHAARIGK